MRTQELRELLEERLIIFDGAMGTQLQARQLTAFDFGGEEFEGCNEHLNLTRPDVIEDIHSAYFEAGADFVETNTFGATALVLDEYGLGTKAYEINKIAAQIAKKTAQKYSKYVAGSMGPTTKSISVTGGVSFDALARFYAEQAQGLIEGGVDLLLLETGQDTLNLKAGLMGIQKALKKLKLNREEMPVMVSGTIEPTGTMLAGQSAEALYTSLEHADLISIGLNCATGPDAMQDHLRALSQLAICYISCMPNAGLPDFEGRYHETPESLAKKLSVFCEKKMLNILGGCCGTTPAHIQAISEMALNFKPRKRVQQTRAAVSGVEYLDLQDHKPLIVGERTNVIGSRLFKDLIVQEKFEEAAEVGRRQVRHGAHIVDVCLANPDRNEQQDILSFLKKAIRIMKAPFMIDSTDAHVIEESLKWIQGKSIINSINLEDGEERFEKICPLAKSYGAAVVVGCIDEDPIQGMALTVERKLEIARRSFDLLTQKYKIPAQDIIFDPLVFPCGTGDRQYIGSAKQTILGVRALKEVFPECMTILGVSNVSFGLPQAGREVLNTVFLHANFEAGLDMAIVNSEKLQRMTQVSEQEKILCEKLLEANQTQFDAVLAEFTAHFRQTKQKIKQDRTQIPVEQRLAQAVVEGSKSNLVEDLEEIRVRLSPLEIINGPLMIGMKEVGDLFGKNQLIVAEVLQSAEVMKAAVSHLEQYMQKSEEIFKGKLLLATVKGDVHDIGKNLVDIILSNNGFQVINLGIKIPAQALIEAYRKHKPDLIGLSGLLVKSAQEMALTAELLREAEIKVPLLVGGAALSERFSYSKIAPAYGSLVCYAKDAMMGLNLANRAVDVEEKVGLEREIQTKKESFLLFQSPTQIVQEEIRRPIKVLSEIPGRKPPDLDLHILENLDLEQMWGYINPVMLYTRHLGLKDRGDNPKAYALKKSVLEIQDWILKEKLLTCRGLYQFYSAFPDRESIRVQEKVFNFPRQPDKDQLCLSDFLNRSGDYLAAFVTTCHGARDLADDLKKRGEYLKSHIVSALAIETAEGAAEWLHQRIRALWGFADSSDLTVKDLFSARYQGKRYSFGYPACPNLEDQAILWDLLEPQKNIGVCLTECFMMDPESSVSALVFHHPEAVYFSVKPLE